MGAGERTSEGACVLDCPASWRWLRLRVDSRAAFTDRHQPLDAVIRVVHPLQHDLHALALLARVEVLLGNELAPEVASGRIENGAGANATARPPERDVPHTGVKIGAGIGVLDEDAEAIALRVDRIVAEILSRSDVPREL